MANPQDRILVFDSGIGGISVLKALLRYLPEEHFLYLGDTANAPYGEKTAEQVRTLTLDALAPYMKQGIKALVVACNTATAAAITCLRQCYPDIPIIGTEPALKTAADRYPGGRIGILATPVTLQEEKLAQLIDKFPDLDVRKIPLPGLAERIEAGQDKETLAEFLRPTLAPYAGKLDAAVLGCTHYPFAAPVLKALLGEKTPLLDGSEGVARQTQKQLFEKNLLRAGQGSITFVSTGEDAEFACRCNKLLSEELP